MSRQELKSLAKQQIKGKIGSLFLVSLVVYAITFAASFIPVVGSVASFVITPAFTLSMATIYLNLTKNPERKPEVSDAFNGFSNVLGAFKVYIAQTVFVFLWWLLFFIPGMVKSIAYSQCFFILSENPEIGGREALKKSQELMNGHKWDYFVLVLSFFGWMILGAFTFGILYIWLIPYMDATMTNFYNSIKPVEAQPQEEVSFN